MMATEEELSADEIALYDRQLRLWGMEAQNRMRKAKVLLVTIRALGNEIAKNLVLAGIGSLTIVDPAVVTDVDVASQFFVTEDNIGENVDTSASTDLGSAPKHPSKKSGGSIHESKFNTTLHQSHPKMGNTFKTLTWSLQRNLPCLCWLQLVDHC
jgi:molybdopterin/thiamine biosynthesis adenylyltransferase